MAKKEYDKRDYHQELTNEILESFDKSIKSNFEIPWFPANRGRPFNALTRKYYSGCNDVSLSHAGRVDPQWLTKPQMDIYARQNKLGLNIIKGSKSRTIFKAYAQEVTEDQNGNPLVEPRKLIFMVRAGSAFNAEQISGMPLWQQKVREFSPLFAGEQLIEALKIKGGLRMIETPGAASYFPTQDVVGLPPKNTFKTDEFYYDVASHETGHWTGHQSRLNRKQTSAFGTSGYAFEEFVAEISSCMVMAEIGIPHDIRRHEKFLDYINDWQRALKADKNLIFKASNAASRAANFQMEILREYLYELVEQQQATVEQKQLYDAVGIPERVAKELQDIEEQSLAQETKQEEALVIEVAHQVLEIETPPIAPTIKCEQRRSMGMRM